MPKNLISKWIITPNCNVYTFRITPHGEYSDKEIVNIFQEFKKIKEIKRLVAFREYTSNSVLHFHSRLEIEQDKFKSKQTLNKYIKKYFKKLIGNKMLGIKSCYINGIVMQKKELWKCRSYTAKDGDIICNKGHTTEEILDMISIGQKLKSISNLPIYQKIINRYKIENYKQIMPSIKEYYKELSKCYPRTYHIQAIATTIHCKINPTFRDAFWKDQEQKFLYFSDEIYQFPTMFKSYMKEEIIKSEIGKKLFCQIIKN